LRPMADFSAMWRSDLLSESPMNNALSTHLP
jgi:hypothetical protein